MIVALILLVVIVHQGATNSNQYCQSDACPDRLPNVGCGCKASTYGPQCKDRNARNIILDDKLKTLLLEQHNTRRNLVACGDVKPHPPAAKMIELVSDVVYVGK